MGVWHGRKHHEKAGAPSFAFFAKGGIRDGRYRDSWYPTLRKMREGWGTRGFVALSAEVKKCPVSCPAGRQRRWMTGKAMETNHYRPTYPGFPVEVGGVVELHAAFLKESGTRGRVWCCVTGNPGTLGRTWGTRPGLPRPESVVRHNPDLASANAGQKLLPRRGVVNNDGLDLKGCHRHGDSSSI